MGSILMGTLALGLHHMFKRNISVSYGECTMKYEQENSNNATYNIIF